MNKCNLCESDNLDRLYTVNGFRTDKKFDVYKCATCSLVSASVTQADIEGAYEADYYETAYPGYVSDKAFHDRNNNAILKDIEKHFPKGNILEVGSAFGFFLEQAKKRGWDVTGYECSEYASKAAQQIYKVNVKSEDFLQSDLGRDYTMFTMLDTIEHLLDPLSMLKKGAQVLKPGGGAYVCTGSFDSLHARLTGKRWRMMVPPLHIYFFTPKTLGDMMEKAGFSIVSCRYHGKYYNFGSIVQFLTGISKEKLPKIPLYINTFDVITMIGRYDG